MQKLTKTDEYYLQIADAVSIKSKCLKKHYGAIIVKNNELIYYLFCTNFYKYNSNRSNNCSLQK